MGIFKNRTRIVSLSVALVVVIGSIVAVKALPENEKTKADIKQTPTGTLVEVIYPKAGEVAQSFNSTGKLKAVYRYEMYAQVEGQLLQSAQNFKVGSYYKKGQVMLEIDQQEYKMNLLAQKSDLITKITGILPDLKTDYPDSYPTWRNYVVSIDVNKNLPKIPTATSEQEQFYLSGKGIYSSYYSVRSAEEKLAKYTIRAPFSGVVTQASVDAGTAVRSGSGLGTFISTSQYDLEVTVPLSLLNKIKVGSEAKLRSADISGEWMGKVVRIGGDIDEQSQSVKVYIRTAGKNLKEGLYLTAYLEQEAFKNAITLPRKLVNDQNMLFVVQENKLKQIEVEILSRSGNDVVIASLPNQTAVLTTVIKSAYNGMPVRISKQQ